MSTPEDGPWQEPTQRIDGDATQWMAPDTTAAGQPTWEERQRAITPGQLEPVGKHVLVAFAVVGVVALLGVAAFFTVRHGGGQQAAPPPPVSTTPPLVTVTSTPSLTTSSAAPTTTTTPPSPSDARSALASQLLSSAPSTMSPSTCALPRFDLPDAKQAQFFEAAKKCADAAWGVLFADVGLPAPTVKLVTVQGSAVQTSCGEVGFQDPATHCSGTVYMTPAYLRDVQGNGRYPGKYFGTFLREYGHALQDVNGLTSLYKAARSQPGADVDDVDRRYVDQAICMAGVASGAMSGLGAVDSNITHEVRERITSGDPAPADAGSWLDKGFSSRQLAACNTWS